MNDDSIELASTGDCRLLESCFDDDLTAGEAAALAAHLERCAACREAVEQQRWIDGLLRSDAAADCERAPSTMRTAAALAVAGSRRRARARRAWTSVAAAAAAVAAIMGWHAARSVSENRRGLAHFAESSEQNVPVPPSADLQAAQESTSSRPPATGGHSSLSPPSPPRLARGDLQGGEGSEPVATFLSTSEAIAVPIASDDLQVTIVKLYPTTMAARRMAIEHVLYDVAAQDGG